MYSPTSVHLNDRASSHFFPLICPSSKILHIQAPDGAADGPVQKGRLQGNFPYASCHFPERPTKKDKFNLPCLLNYCFFGFLLKLRFTTSKKLSDWTIRFGSTYWRTARNTLFGSLEEKVYVPFRFVLIA